MGIASQKDFAAGLMYVVVGSSFAVTASTYRMGAASGMGPGFFPFCLGFLLAVLGVIVIANSFQGSVRQSDNLARWDVKTLVVVLSSVFAFGALLPTMGLVISISALVVGSSFASAERRWGATIASAIVLILMSVALFVYGLRLPLPVLPSFVGV